jgi:hypothetical protein
VKRSLVIERSAEQIEGGRAQLVERVFVDGQSVSLLPVKRGSPAPVETVRAYEEVISITIESESRA